MNIQPITSNNKTGVIIVKKSLVLLLCATLILMIVIFADFPHKSISGKTGDVSESDILYNNTLNSTSSQGSSSPESIAGSEAPKTFYIVKEYNGHIGVFKNTSDKPFKEYDVPVSTLPIENQMKLKSSEGYREESLGDVEKLIEDFDG